MQSKIKMRTHFGTVFVTAALAVGAAAGGAYSAAPVAVSSGMPLSVWTNKAGRVVHDFGQDAFGWAEVRLASGSGEIPEPVEIMLGEKLDGLGVDMSPGGSVRAALCRVAGLSPGAWQRVPMKADKRNTGPQAVKLPSEIGVVMPFRYVESPADIEVRRMSVAVPMEMSASSFRCSDAKLNEVYGFCKYTIFATSFAGLYVDGDRERIPYEADAYINMLGEQAVWTDGGMAKATMLHLLGNPTWPTEWQLHMPMMAHDYWMATGDIETIRANYGRLKKLLLRDMAREGDGLLVTQWERNAPLCDIVDWPRCERDRFVFTNVNSVVNAFHIRALRDMARLSSALGENGDAEIFAREARAKADAFLSVFVDGDAGLVRDGEGVGHSSIHANIAAIAFGLLPDNVRGKVMARVRARGMACSTYFAQYLLEACFAAGFGEYARALMTDDGGRGWLGMKKAGATMCMESWSAEVKPNQDWNHAWSAAPLNIVSRFVLGVRPLEPSARKLLIAPDLCGMEFAEGTVPTAEGSVKVSATVSNLVVETPVPARVVWRGTAHEVSAGKHEFR